MPSPFSQTYTSPEAVLFAKNIEPILLTHCINTETVPTKIIRPKNRKTVPRVKLPPIVIISKL